jgi:hypothetical protein
MPLSVEVPEDFAGWDWLALHGLLASPMKALAGSVCSSKGHTIHMSDRTLSSD